MKEFNLSEKRKELFSDLINAGGMTNNEMNLLRSVEGWINEQDKEFIKKLKEKFVLTKGEEEPNNVMSWNKDFHDEIDKLAGDLK